MLECPICKKETGIICDNNCGTYYCTCMHTHTHTYGLEFYYNYIECIYIEGHHPGCNIDDIEDNASMIMIV